VLAAALRAETAGPDANSVLVGMALYDTTARSSSAGASASREMRATSACAVSPRCASDRTWRAASAP
jgi:hypothetical protein